MFSLQTSVTRLALMLCIGAGGAVAQERMSSSRSDMVLIPAGEFTPLYGTVLAGKVRVETFRLDRRAVTRGQFENFLQNNGEWRRDSIRSVYAGRDYLADWESPVTTGGDQALPVTQVSWFAARAYCAAQGKRLPTTDEWEYVGAASATERNASLSPVFIAEVLARYSLPAGVRARGSTSPNAYGVAGMHGGPWEWTEDFNGVLVSADSRTSGSTVRHSDFRSVCATSAIGASNPNDYPAFLRYAFRSALDARATLDLLGFRCAADA